jgi:hypothetical protein
MAIKAVAFCRPDYCNKCNTERAIECYDVYSRPINYTLIMDYVEKGKIVTDIIDKRELSHMECKKCKTQYNLDWTKAPGYPVPLLDNFPVMILLGII